MEFENILIGVVTIAIAATILIAIGIGIGEWNERASICQSLGYDWHENIDGVLYCYTGDPPNRQYVVLEDLLEECGR